MKHRVGLRPGRGTGDISATQELIYDINRRLKTDHASNENDAKSCYDRIVTSLMSLVNRANGMPKSWVRTHARVITQAKFHIKSLLGISDLFYTHSEDSPVYGTGQGTGDSSNQWGMLSSIILRIMHERANSAHFEAPDKSETEDVSNTAFVDDTSGYQNEYNREEDTIRTLIEMMKEDVTNWDQLLLATGGMLELIKCLFFLTIWKFNEDGSARILTPAENKAKLIINRPDGTQVEIQQKDAHEAHTLLGIKRGPSGNQDHELKALEKKSNNFARSIISGGLSRSDTHDAYFTNYIPAMSYPLNITSIGSQKLQQAQRQAKAAFLTGMGYNRHMPLEVVYGSPKLGGIGMYDLGDQEGVLGTTTLLRFLNME